MRRRAPVGVKLVLTALIAAAAFAIWQGGRVPPVVIPDRPPLEGRIDRIVIEKQARRLTVYRDGAALKSYRVALGFSPVGDKARQGDGRTPEGLFRIDRRNAQSAFHLSLGIDYPQPDDVARARAGGYSPGGDIFIHGQPNGYDHVPTLGYDWTEGCIALADAEIEELWRATPMGTEVEIRP
ncbi:MAG: L,D-transpeptidase family protein [Maritimibacter sp.]|nr:L,D-transpeptidase family protein [Maritimibacter sp.]